MSTTVTEAANPLHWLQRATSLIVQTDLANRDPSVRQIAILFHLADQPEPAPSIKEIAAHFGINKPATTRNVDRLEMVHKFVKRTQDHQDRRRVEVRITPAGRTYVNRLVDGLRGAS